MTTLATPIPTPISIRPAAGLAPLRLPPAPVDVLADLYPSSLHAEGPFSIVVRGTFTIDAVAGLVIRVHAGCLWVPDDEAQCSVGVGPAEHFVVPRAGRLTVLAAARTQLELGWPEVC